MAGLPLDSWLLVAASVGIGLAIEAAFLWARRRDPSPPPHERPR